MRGLALHRRKRKGFASHMVLFWLKNNRRKGECADQRRGEGVGKRKKIVCVSNERKRKILHHWKLISLIQVYLLSYY